MTEAVTKFSESVSYDKRLYSQDLKGSRAHCKMLAAQVSHAFETAVWVHRHTRGAELPFLAEQSQVVVRIVGA